MSKHTPGHWYYDSHDKLNPDRAGGIVVDLGQDFAEICGVERATEVIAEVCHAEGDMADRDGKLLAAAPRLLQTLKNLAATARTFRNVPKDEQEWTPIDDEALNEAFAIINELENTP